MRTESQTLGKLCTKGMVVKVSVQADGLLLPAAPFYTVTSVHLPIAYFHASAQDKTGHLLDVHVPCCKDTAMQCADCSHAQLNLRTALWY